MATAAGTSSASAADAANAPLVSGVPLFGNTFQIAREPFGFFVEAYRRFGPVSRFRIPGHEFVLLAGVEANRAFVEWDGAVFSSRKTYPELIRQVATERYLPATDGAEHLHLRKALHPAFSREALAAYLPRIVEIVRRTVRSWEAEPRVLALDAMTRLGLEVMSYAMANESVGTLHRDIATYAATFTGSGVAFRPSIFLRLPPYVPAKRRFERFLEGIIGWHRVGGEDEKVFGARRFPDLVDRALDVRDLDGEPLDEKTLLATAHLPYVNTVSYLGRVSTYLLHLLLSNPSAMERVLAEVDAALAAPPLTPTLLQRMSFLRGAVLEALRLYPVAVALPRYVVAPFEFAGYRVEPGRLVFVGTSVTHFLPECFPSPRAFDPERWSEARRAEHQTGAFAAFGLGTHACLAAGAVELTIMTMMAGILGSVRLELDRPGHALRTVLDPLPGPERSFAIRAVGRRAASAVAAAPLPPTDAELAMLAPDLSRERLAEVVAGLRRQQYAPGTAIVRQGDPADAFYIVTKGEAEVLDESVASGRRFLAHLAAGDFFGETGLLHNTVRNATVRAVTSVEALVMDRETFAALVTESNMTSAEIARVIRRRSISTSLATALPTLDRSRAAALLEHAELIDYPPGTVIMRQGDPADRFYILTRGRVDVRIRAADGRESVVNSLDPGCYFGEIGLLRGGARTATVQASADGSVSVVALSRAGFEKLIAESEQTHRDIAAVMYERLTSNADRARTFG